MEYTIYSAEFKKIMVDEYLRRDISERAFCIEKNIKYTTFRSWLRKVKNQNILSLTPIDITSETKEIVNQESNEEPGTFTLETRGMKLTFSIKNLRDVMRIINND